MIADVREMLMESNMGDSIVLHDALIRLCDDLGNLQRRYTNLANQHAIMTSLVSALNTRIDTLESLCMGDDVDYTVILSEHGLAIDSALSWQQKADSEQSATNDTIPF